MQLVAGGGGKNVLELPSAVFAEGGGGGGKLVVSDWLVGGGGTPPTACDAVGGGPG